MKRELFKLGKFNVIVQWEPPESLGICPSTIACFFALMKKKVVEQTIETHIKVHKRIKVPKTEHAKVENLIEWLGALSLNCTMKSDDYLSSYDAPEPNEEMETLLYVQYIGFISHNNISAILKSIT